MSRGVDLAQIRAAAGNIAHQVRRTPLVGIHPTRHRATVGRLSLKLECLQVTGTFKARGAMNKLSSLSETERKRGLITASGGNHGIAVAHAGWLAGVPATIYLPSTTPPAKQAKIRHWGGRIEIHGDVWDDANAAAQARAAKDGLTYVHPFADPLVIAGQGTIGLELHADEPELDTLLVAIGGGGLISGVSIAAKALNPNLRIVGVEPTGAPTLLESVRAGQPVRLAHIDTMAGTLAPRESAPINVEIISELVDDIVLVSDDDMREAARWLWTELGIAAELSGAATVAALLNGQVTTGPEESVCALVCGAGTDGLIAEAGP
jgi:threonine dehydratase